MPKIAAALLTFLLIAPPVAAQCPTPRGPAISPISVEPLCGYRAGAIASNGEEVIGAWMTSRPGFSDISGTIAGGLLDSSGRLREGAQRVFMRAPAAPSIASDGTNFLLVYNDAGATRATLLAPDGRVLNAVNIGTAPGLSRLQAHGGARVVWNGADYIVLTDELRGEPGSLTSRVLAAAVTREGNVRATEVLADDARIVTLAPGASGRALAVWRRGNNVVGTVLDGVDAGGTRGYAPFDDAFITAAGNGASYLLVIQKAQTAAIMAMHLDAAGEAGPVFWISGPAAGMGVAAVPEGANGWLVFFRTGNDTVAARVVDSAVSMPFAVIEGDVLAATPTGAGTVVLAKNACGTTSTALVPRGETRSAAVTAVSVAGMAQSTAATAPTDTGHQLFWYQPRGETFNQRLFASHVRGGVASAPLDLTGDASAHSVDASPFLGGSVAVWDESGAGTMRVRLARFSPNGELVDEVDVATPSFAFRSVVTVHGETIAVLTSVHATSAALMDVHATFYDRNLRVIDHVLLAVAEDAYYADIAFDEGRWWASWSNVNRSSDPATLEHVLVDIETGQRVVKPVPEPLPSRVAAPGADPMILWTTQEELHAYFPHSGRRVVVANPDGLAVDFRAERRGEAIDLYWADLVEAESRVTVYRATITPDGVHTDALLCLNTSAFPSLVLREGRVSAVALAQGTLSLHENTRRVRAVR